MKCLMRTVLLDIFISDLDTDVNTKVEKSAGDTKLFKLVMTKRTARWALQGHNKAGHMGSMATEDF